MKKILSIALLLTVGAFGLAYAGYNEVQRDWGGSALVPDSATAGHPASHGDVGMSVDVTGIDAAMTWFVVPAKSGLIARIYAVMHNALSTDANSPTFTFYTADPASAANNDWTRVTDLSNESLADLSSISWSVGATGVAGIPTHVVFATSVSSAFIKAGDTIAIVGDGDATGGTSATFTLIIE